MATPNQYNFSLSQEKSLIPADNLIDGRSELDLLSFMSNFSELINFYDQNNNVNGNWKPFLLKDPTFLQAYIGKTRFNEFFLPYSMARKNLIQLFPSNTKKNNPPPVINCNDTNTHFFLNQLFNQTIRAFNRMAEWTYFMQIGSEKYDLKEYLIHQINSKYNQTIWALLGLRTVLLNEIDAYTFVRENFYVNGYANEKLWFTGKDVSPYSQILNLTNYDENEQRQKESNTLTSSNFSELLNTTDQVFNFFKTVITHGVKQYQKSALIKSNYPDTTLLRVFLQLLQIHQEQLNGISKKHLEFYYKNILEQNLQLAKPDSAYLFLQLAKKGQVFKLPASTLFNAGLDATKNPILFDNPTSVNINPGQIQGAFTICQEKNSSTSVGNSTLYINQVSTPTALQKGIDGSIVSWDTFGSASCKTAKPTSLGIAFASPMLYLPEGNRIITLTLQFKQELTENDIWLIQNATYALSGTTNWQNVKPSFSQGSTALPLNEYKVTLTLTPDNTSVLPFTINPDGYESQWPLLKLTFNAIPDFAQPPVLTNLIINVVVTGLSSLQLSSDYGTLNPKKPFTPFGPTPNCNSSFFIGSNEVFSKPIDYLRLNLNWDNLPPDFLAYYQFYNDYLAVPPDSFPPSNSTLVTTTTKKGILTSIWNFISRGNKSTPSVTTPPTTTTPSGPYNNCAFRAHFSVLQQYTWNDCTVYGENTISPASLKPPPDPFLFIPDNSITPIAPVPTIPTINFTYYVPDHYAKVQFSPDPTLQLVPLKFSNNNSSGFLKMSLSSPSVGFGADIYANVISYIAMQNALNVVVNKKVSNLPVNVPFTPKLSAITAEYSATQSYTTDFSKNDYPLQCFHYTPFAAYLVHDNTKEVETYANNVGQPVTGMRQIQHGVNLFSPLKYNGILYLEIADLVACESVNLYFDLAQTLGNPSNTQLEFYVLASSQWELLTVLSDTTNNLNCSGLIQLAIPSTLTNKNLKMPGQNYWLSVATTGDIHTYAQTCFLNINAVLTQRTGANFLTNSTAPRLAAGAISKTQSPLPPISTITQPLASFGGKAAEDSLLMNERISKRIKTKDRAITSCDYFSLIRENFSDVYYTKVHYEAKTGNTNIYIVNKYQNYTLPNAFTPATSPCEKENISSFLKSRVSGFTQIQVYDFVLNYIQFKVTICLSPGFELEGVQATVSQSLKLFLSPWIKTNQKQISIDEGINVSQIAAFISNLSGVAGVSEVQILSGYPGTQTPVTNNNIDRSSLLPGILLVPNPIQIINLAEQLIIA